MEKNIEVILKKLRDIHYLFYFRDETFECISESYRFHVLKEEFKD